MNMALQHLALPRSQWALCSHDIVPLWSTCWSDLGQQMFQLHSIGKSMTIDLEEIPARIHHAVRFKLWKSALLHFVLLLNGGKQAYFFAKRET